MEFGGPRGSHSTTLLSEEVDRVTLHPKCSYVYLCCLLCTQQWLPLQKWSTVFSLIRTVVCCLPMGILSEQWVIRQVCHLVNSVECTYTNLHAIACCTPRLCDM